MNVIIQTVHFVADEKLTQLVTQKTKKLNHFHDGITKIEIFLKLDNVVHQIKDKVVEICVHVPKHDFFVKDTAKTFEPLMRIELTTSSLPRKCSTTEPQRPFPSITGAGDEARTRHL